MSESLNSPNPQIVDYIRLNCYKQSRTEIDQYLVKTGFELTEIEQAWQILLFEPISPVLAEPVRPGRPSVFLIAGKCFFLIPLLTALLGLFLLTQPFYKRDNGIYNAFGSLVDTFTPQYDLYPSSTFPIIPPGFGLLVLWAVLVGVNLKGFFSLNKWAGSWTGSLIISALNLLLISAIYPFLYFTGTYNGLTNEARWFIRDGLYGSVGLGLLGALFLNLIAPLVGAGLVRRHLRQGQTKHPGTTLSGSAGQWGRFLYLVPVGTSLINLVALFLPFYTATIYGAMFNAFKMLIHPGRAGSTNPSYVYNDIPGSFVIVPLAFLLAFNLLGFFKLSKWQGSSKGITGIVLLTIFNFLALYFVWFDTLWMFFDDFVRKEIGYWILFWVSILMIVPGSLIPLIVAIIKSRHLPHLKPAGNN